MNKRAIVNEWTRDSESMHDRSSELVIVNEWIGVSSKSEKSMIEWTSYCDNEWMIKSIPERASKQWK